MEREAVSEVYKENLVKLRLGKDTDFEFVVSTWLNGLYYGNDLFRCIPSTIFKTNHRNVIVNLLSKPAVRVNIACDAEDPDIIYGYAVLEGDDILHWVFVKKSFRNFGIAKSLIPNNIKIVTHLTHLGYSLKPYHVKFNPYLI